MISEAIADCFKAIAERIRHKHDWAQVDKTWWYKNNRGWWSWRKEMPFMPPSHAEIRYKCEICSKRKKVIEPWICPAK